MGSAKFTIGIIVAVVLTGLLVGPAPLGWPFLGECRPAGNLTYFGAPAPIGTRLQAKIEGVVVAETTVTVTGKYSLSIPPDDPQTTAHDGWNTDYVITVWVNSYEARPLFAAFEGSKEINLTVSAISLDVKKSTWGKIKALFR